MGGWEARGWLGGGFGDLELVMGVEMEFVD